MRILVDMFHEPHSDEFSLIDAIGWLPTRKSEGTYWRIVPEGRDPCQFFSGRNRWDDGLISVMYAADTRDGAIAEMSFHMNNGLPVSPSKLKLRMYEIYLCISSVADLTNPQLLSKLGITKDGLSELPLLLREGGFEACQAVSEEAYALGGDSPTDISAIIVPSTYHLGKNIIVFGDHLEADAIVDVVDHGQVDLRAQWS